MAHQCSGKQGLMGIKKTEENEDEPLTLLTEGDIFGVRWELEVYELKCWWYNRYLWLGVQESTVNPALWKKWMPLFSRSETLPGYKHIYGI